MLDVGAAIEAFDGNVIEDRTPLRQESRQTAIDQLRVALSRATETLAVVNVEPDARKDLSTLALVGGAGRYNQDDIIARFGDETATRARWLAALDALANGEWHSVERVAVRARYQARRPGGHPPRPRAWRPVRA